MKKRIISMLLALSCSSILFVGSAGAADNTGTEETKIEYSNELAQEIDLLFQNKEDYKVINANGEDITSDFFSRNTTKYEQGEMDSIVNELANNGLTIICDATYPFEVSPTAGTDISPRYIVGVTARKQITSFASIGKKKFYFKYYVYGTYKVNDGNFQIMEVTGGPYIDNTNVKTDVDSSTTDSYTFIYLNGSHYLNPDKKSVVFSGNFIIRIISSVAGIFPEDTKVNFRFTGYGNGNVA